MGIYTNRLKSRLAREALREAAKEGKNWIVTKGLILEAEDEAGDVAELELNPGDTVEVGADAENGDMAIKSSAAVVVISDEEIARKVADVLTNSDELSDVNFVERPALDAIMSGEDTEAVVDKLADNEDDAEDIEVAEVEIEAKESVEAKFAKFAKNIIHSDKFLTCEAISVDEEHNAPLNMSVIKSDNVMLEAYGDYDKFVKRVSELNGSLQPGEKEIVLSESGKVIGSFDKASSFGKLFLENEFETVEEMDEFNTEPEMLEKELSFETNDVPAEEIVADEDELSVEEKVEACLKGYEESAKSGEDYMTFVNGLEKANLKESVIKTIAGSFNDRAIKECVRVFDSKYGVFVRAFHESVDADNFSEETKEAKRFTKRFFG